MLPRNCLLFFVLISSGLISCRKDLLHWQSAEELSSGTTNRLNRILFVNDTLGFIVGGDRFNAADLLETHDGGHSWQQRSIPEIGKALYAIAGNADGNIYATGFEGKLLHTADFGANWSITDQRYDSYKAMAIGKDKKLLLIGGISFDYGFIQRADATGNRLSYDSLNYELNDLRMLPYGTGYISAYGAVLKTVDNGITWNRLEAGDDNFRSLHVVSAQEVWVCGFNGGIYHSLDGGTTWERNRNGNDLTLPRYHLESILFTDQLHGFAVGEQGLVIYTDDGGNHWVEFDRFTNHTLHSIMPAPDGSLVVCGDNGTLFRLVKK